MCRKRQQVQVTVLWTGPLEEIRYEITADQGLGSSLQDAKGNGVEEGEEGGIDVEGGLLIVLSCVPSNTANLRHPNQL